MEIYHPKDEELLREMKRVRRSAKRRRLIWGLVIWLVLSAAAGLFVFNRYYRLTRMHGAAMGDTLPSGALVLVRRTEEGKQYSAGDILLYENEVSVPMEITVLSPKGKIRDYCQYRLYRELGTTIQYLSRPNGEVSWVQDQNQAEVFIADEEGKIVLETEGLQNGEYYLREIKASYGQDLLANPYPVTVRKPTRTQMKRVLGAGGDNIILSPNTETRVNGRLIDRSRASGRSQDGVAETRRVVIREGEYFVQGDQLSLSVDSRSSDYDTVSRKEVLGRAEFVLWPLRCFGTLTDLAPVTGNAGQEGAR